MIQTRIHSKILHFFLSFTIVNLFFPLSADAEETIYPLVVDPTVSTSDWISMKGALGAQSNVTCMAYTKGILFLGGSFTTVGALHVPGFATWDGSSWDSLGSLEYVVGNNSLQSCAVCSDGNPVIASYAEVARWNGTAWDLLASLKGVNSIVCDHKGTIYISIQYPGQGEAFSSYIARLDGSAWSKLGTGMDSAVSALACDKSGNLFATGHFLSAGGKPASRIAKWDGTDWSTLGAGLDDYGSSLSFDSSGTLFVSGNFDSAGGVAAKRIARWDGATWSPVGSGIEGSYWNTGNIILTCDGTGNVYAAGHFDTAGGTPSKNIAKWNGTGWEPLGTGVDESSSAFPPISCLASDGSANVYVGGFFNYAGGIRATCIARWDGGAWHRLYPKTATWDPDGAITDPIRAFAFDDAGSLYAGVVEYADVGWNDTRSAGYTKLTNDGWQKAVSGRILRNANGNNMILTDTSGVNSSAFNGAFRSPFIGSRKILLTAGSPESSLFCSAIDIAVVLSPTIYFKWNGSSWDSIGRAVGLVYDMVCDAAGNLYTIEETSDPVHSRLKKWDSTGFREFATFGKLVLSENIYAIACDLQGNLYVAGEFKGACDPKVPDGCYAAYSIAKWNGTRWENLGNPGEYYMSEFYSLALDNKGRLYAGNSQLFRFDGTCWSQLGKMPEAAIIKAITVVDSFVFIGGTFQTIPGSYSPFVAKVNTHRVGNTVISVPGRTAAPGLRYRTVDSKLFITNGTPLDRSYLFTLNGRCVRKAVGVSPLRLSGLSSQQLILKIMRGARTATTDKVLIP